MVENFTWVATSRHETRLLLQARLLRRHPTITGRLIRQLIMMRDLEFLVGRANMRHIRDVIHRVLVLDKHIPSA